MAIRSLFTLILPVFSTLLSAQTTVQIDFGRIDDGQPTPDLGWNNVTANVGSIATNITNLPDLVDSTGDPTGITLDLVYKPAASGAGSAADWLGPYPDAVSSMPATAISDSFFTNGSGGITMTFSGLKGASTYEIMLYGGRGNNGNPMNWIITGGGDPITAEIDHTFQNSTQAPVVSEITPDPDGIITIQVSSTGAVNVLTITESLQIDTDEDGMPDQYETDNGTDPLVKDADLDKDGDGLTNLQEYLGQDSNGVPTGFGQTLSGNADTDSDDIEDGDEITGILNPWDDSGFPDGPPGLPTNPRQSDSDNDSLSDGAEILTHGTDPNWDDSDLDTLPDAFEVAYGLDPTDGTGDNGADGDPDNDELFNSEEATAQTDPKNEDTDDDDLKDGYELFTSGTDPLLKDTDGDFLEDGDELNEHSTDPVLVDSDFDGHRDNIELLAGSDPNLDSSVPTYGPIDWSVQEFNDVSQLNNSGILFTAQNCNGPEAVANGITFSSQISAGAAKASPEVQTVMTLQTTDQGIYDDAIPELSDLLETVWYKGSDATANNVAIAGLTPGKTYQIQFARADDRNNASIVGRWAFVDSLGGETGSDPVGPTNTIYGGSANPAILFSGTFTATSTVQGFSTGHNASGGVYAGTQLAFIQVREVEAAATFSIDSVSLDGSSFEAHASGLDTGAQYQLLRSANLADGFPTIVDGPRLPSAATDVFTDPNRPAGKAFYQLEELP